MSALFPAVLGNSFKQLHPAVARFHGAGPGARAEGLFRVTRGNGPFSYAMGWIMGLPRAAAALPVTLQITACPRGEPWNRKFGTQSFHSQMWEEGGRLIEAIGFTRFAFQLREEAGALVFRTIGCKVIGLSMPKCVWPQIQVCAGPSNTAPESHEVFSILVTLSLPLLGLVVKYEGEMKQTSEPSNS